MNPYVHHQQKSLNLGYNYHQRLTEVREDGAFLGAYTFDALGRRTKKTANGTTTLYLYDKDGLLIAEYDITGTWRKDYVYMNGRPLGMVVAGASESLYYYHNDHLGTPQEMTDADGVVVWEAAYLPFWDAVVYEDVDGDGMPVVSNMRFPGQYFDAETGLHYNWHRDYDPGVGRYVESDPIGLRGGVNLYLYAKNNPKSNFDLKGLCTECDDCPGGKWSGAGLGGQGYFLSGAAALGVYRVDCWSSNKTCWISVICGGQGFGYGIGASGDSMWITGTCNASDLEGKGGTVFGGGGINAWGSSGSIGKKSATLGVGYGYGGGYGVGSCTVSILSCSG